ncbi:MAG TPA: hypothetical protein PLV59_02430 [Candidatus Dojkabacteria bacterium]|nr:hypothetical protein [Candidatus Dojkabacteria bacterium]
MELDRYYVDYEILTHGFTGDPQRAREGKISPQVREIVDTKIEEISNYEASIKVGVAIQNLPYDIEGEKKHRSRDQENPISEMLKVSGRDEHQFRNDFRMKHLIYDSKLDTLTIFLEDQTVIMIATTQWRQDSKLEMFFRSDNGKIGSIKRDNMGKWRDSTAENEEERDELLKEFTNMEKIKAKYTN